MSRNVVVVSWLSYNNDPFERERSGHYRKGNDGERVPGPSLELLTNPDSPYQGRVKKAYFLLRRNESGSDEGRPRERHPREDEVFEELRAELARRDRQLQVEARVWSTVSPPTAHEAILDFTAAQLRRIRAAHPKAKIIVNLSPGTPQMQTVMLLALQAGLAGQDVVAVQGIPRDRRNRDAHLMDEVPVDLVARLNRNWARFVPAHEPDALWTLARARSPALQRVWSLVENYGGMPYPVLLLGARGSGKSTVAAELRQRFFSARGQALPAGELFRANCATFVGDVARSELFGHEAGSFTGANREHAGLLERARGDCVFLDEIHHLSHPVQAMLLVALEERGRFGRIGGQKDIQAAFRLICASNRSREELRSHLYEDFYDRIATYEIDLPPLRDCKADLPAIWDRVVWDTASDFARRAGPQEVNPRLVTDAIAAHRKGIVGVLVAHPLSANWRDLQQLARRLLAIGASGRLLSLFELDRSAVDQLLEDFAEAPRRPVRRSDEPVGLVDELPTEDRCRAALQDAVKAGTVLSFRELTETWAARLLTAAHDVASNKQAAAELLGMRRKTYADRLAEAIPRRGSSGAR